MAARSSRLSSLNHRLGTRPSVLTALRLEVEKMRLEYMKETLGPITPSA